MIEYDTIHDNLAPINQDRPADVAEVEEVILHRQQLETNSD